MSDSILVAFSNDISPPDNVIQFFDEIRKIKNKNSPSNEPKDFLHMLNIISLNNKSLWLPKIRTIIQNEKKANKKDEYCTLFSKTVLSSNLFTNLLVEIFDFFENEEQQNILNIFLKTSLTVSNSILLGKFIGCYMLMKDYSHEKVQDTLLKFENDYPGLLISASIEFCKSKKYSEISKMYYERFENQSLDTKMIMLLYDLESFFE
tara:strand:+ start:7216 stop:7833 length:618 start_codon:yes stop_codon:yes gene_type:complete